MSRLTSVGIEERARMTIRIGSNITSLLIQRNLAEADTRLSSSLERLSSGQRINRASDDAAGLAISLSLNASSRVFSQGVRNVSDGVSYLNIADGALSELSNITNRQIELAEQSANGVYSTVQRQAMNTEANKLVDEFNRIVKSTQFNGQAVIDVEQSSGLVRIQAGYGLNGSVGLSVGADLSRFVGTGSFGSAAQYTTESTQTNALVLADVNNDGNLDLVTAGQTGMTTSVRLNDGQGGFGAATHYTTEGAYSNALVMGDVDGDGDVDMVTSGYDWPSGTGSVSIRLNDGHGLFGALVKYSAESDDSRAVALSDINGDGSLDLISAGFQKKATIRLNDGRGHFGSATQYSFEMSPWSMVMGDVNGDDAVDMVVSGFATPGKAIVYYGNGKGGFGYGAEYDADAFAVTLADVNNDGSLDLITAGSHGGKGTATVRLNDGSGVFGSMAQYSTDPSESRAVTMSDINGDGHVDLLTAGYSAAGASTYCILLNDGQGSFGTGVCYTDRAGGAENYAIAAADIDKNGSIDLVTAGWGGGGRAYVHKAIGRNVTTVASLNLCTQKNARLALDSLRSQLDRISSERGTIGAMQSRLAVASATLSTSRENFDAAGSRIKDADIASESASMVKNQIVQQAAASVLAQANQSPALALTLLR